MKRRHCSRPGEQPYDAMGGGTGSGHATPVARERNPTAPRVPGETYRRVGVTAWRRAPARPALHGQGRCKQLMKRRHCSRPGEQPYDAMGGGTGSGRATPVARERNPPRHACRQKRIGGSACRRVGVVGTRSCASGVARPRKVQTTYEKAPLLEAGRATL